MARYIGQCSKCGSNQHPKGNVFRIMDKLFFELDYPHKSIEHVVTDTVKVCNNCNEPHNFQRRLSAKRKAKEELFARLLAEFED